MLFEALIIRNTKMLVYLATLGCVAMEIPLCDAITDSVKILFALCRYHFVFQRRFVFEL